MTSTLPVPPRFTSVPSGPVIEQDAATAAVRRLLAALGQDVDDPELRETPRRVTEALTEMLSPGLFTLTTFENVADYDELVLVRDIPVSSLCAHHLLPFTGTAHVAYLPGERIVGLSKLARAVEMFSRGLQVQERLTTQISGWLEDVLAPRGVGVVVEAEHLCMTMRGVQARGARTLTSSLRGLVRDDARTRAEFLALVT
ncbi:MAG: GTP cyclohydrolase I FolE [Nocardioidaceae bacterium]